MSIRTGRIAARAVTAIVLLVGVLAATGVDAGAAGSPTISISPTTVPLGQQVTVDLSGFPTVPSPVPWGVMLCPASWAATGDHAEAAWHCTLIEGTVATSVPAQVVVNAVDGGSPIAGGDLFTCVGPAGTCVIAGVQLDQSFRATAYAEAPITITAPVSSVSLGSSSVASGGTTTVTTTGFPAGVVTIGVCLRATTAANALSWCDPLTTQASGSTSTSVRVPYTNRLNGSLENCTACDIGAYVIDPAQPDRVITFASAPITVTPPTLDLAPAGPYDDGQTVTVTSAGIRPGNVEVALCASITSDLSHCGPATSVTIGPDWQLSTTIAMQRMIVAPPGNTARTRCESSCQVLVRAAAPADHQFVLASTQVAVRQPAVEIDQLGPFRDLQGVTVKVTGFPAATARVVQCRAPVAATLSGSACNTSRTQQITVDGSGSGQTAPNGLVLRTPYVDRGTTVDCVMGPCVVASFRTDGRFVAASAVMSIAESPVLTLTPSIGLHDGDPIAVRATGLTPGWGATVRRCSNGTYFVCESLASRIADQYGRITTTVPAAQRLSDTESQPDGSTRTRHAYCTDQCTISVSQSYWNGVEWVSVYDQSRLYKMATPRVTATPSTGLTDGQSVTVVGSDLQPTYAGPTVLLPTGGWAVTMCDAAVGTRPNLVQLFQHCAMPPGFGPVAVPGSTSSTTVRTPRTITKILGGTTSCGASPGACVIGLSRWEQDGTVSVVFTPLTFA